MGRQRPEDDMISLKRLIGACAIGLALAGAAQAQAPEKPTLTLGVGGKPALGYFKEQGLDVTINDFRGGAQSLQALAGGSVDVVTGAYEHTIRMWAKDQP